MGDDSSVPELYVHHFIYKYLADDEAFASRLRNNNAIQKACGVATSLMSPDEIAIAYPFYKVDDIVLSSHNLVDEGYFDVATMFNWLRLKARQTGVCYITDEVIDLSSEAGKLTSVTLASNTVIRDR